MKTLSTWLALAGLFFMSAGHSLAATCPPGMPTLQQSLDQFEKVAAERKAEYAVHIKDMPDGVQIVFLIIKEGSAFGASASGFLNGCRLPGPAFQLDPVRVADKAFGSTLAAIFARET